jgi:uncharacterized membrane protein YjgN (DUF898 family)
VKDNHAAVHGRTDLVALRFSGRAGEYFSIWIVNLCLSIVTLGIYSAWAKVRRKRYFYGNTRLREAAFDYLADPKAILKGRLLVVAALVVYSVTEKFVPLAALGLALLFLLAFPWLMVRALRFNARNSAHRAVRFGFRGTYGQMWRHVGVPAILVPLTLGIAFPWLLYRRDRFVIENSSYGATGFGFRATAGQYYAVSLKVFAAGLGFLLGSIVTFGIGAIPLYLLVRSYAEAAMARLKWDSTALSEIRFSCDWTTGGLFRLQVVNALGIVFSLGLLVPWAAIRTARYKLERLSLSPGAALGGFIASNEAQVAAIGEEAGELFGFDFGL